MSMPRSYTLVLTFLPWCWAEFDHTLWSWNGLNFNSVLFDEKHRSFELVEVDPLTANFLIFSSLDLGWCLFEAPAGYHSYGRHQKTCAWKAGGTASFCSNLTRGHRRCRRFLSGLHAYFASRRAKRARTSHRLRNRLHLR